MALKRDLSRILRKDGVFFSHKIRQVVCNSLEKVEVRELDWTDFDPEDALFRGIDCVLCSDCVQSQYPR